MRSSMSMTVSGLLGPLWKRLVQLGEALYRLRGRRHRAPVNLPVGTARLWQRLD